MNEEDQLKVEILKAKGYGLRLLYRGYVFLAQKRSKNYIQWVCSNTTCKSTIMMVDNNLPLPILNLQHNHPVDPLKVAAARIRPTVATILWVPTQDQKFKRLVVGNKPLEVILNDKDNIYDKDCPVNAKEDDPVSTAPGASKSDNSSTTADVEQKIIENVIAKNNTEATSITSVFTPIVTPVPLARMQQQFVGPKQSTKAPAAAMPAPHMMKQPQMLQQFVANISKSGPHGAQYRTTAAKTTMPGTTITGAKQPGEKRDDEVCLKWSNHHGNMQSTLPILLQREQFTDITLCAEGKYIQCHRLVLSSCSPYFDEVISNVSPWQHPVIFLKDVSFDIVKGLVNFIYIGEVVIQKSKLEEFYSAAQQLKIKGLANLAGGPATAAPSNVMPPILQPEAPMRLHPKPPQPVSKAAQMARPNFARPVKTPTSAAKSKVVYRLSLPKQQLQQISLEEAKTMLKRVEPGSVPTLVPFKPPSPGEMPNNVQKDQNEPNNQTHIQERSQSVSSDVEPTEVEQEKEKEQEIEEPSIENKEKLKVPNEQEDCEVRISPSFAKRPPKRSAPQPPPEASTKEELSPTRRGTKSRPFIRAPKYYNVSHKSKSLLRHRKPPRRSVTGKKGAAGSESQPSSANVSEAIEAAVASAAAAVAGNSGPSSKTPPVTSTPTGTPSTAASGTKAKAIPQDPLALTPETRPPAQTNAQPPEPEFNILNIKTETLDISETGVSYSDCMSEQEQVPASTPRSKADSAPKEAPPQASTSTVSATPEVMLPITKQEPPEDDEDGYEDEEDDGLAEPRSRKRRRRRRKRTAAADGNKSSIDIKSLKEKLQSKYKQFKSAPERSELDFEDSDLYDDECTP